MADHNDPNAVNSAFSDIDVSAADLYDVFGFPSDDLTNGEAAVIALTFANVPGTGVFDTDMLYRVQMVAEPRVARQEKDHSLETLLSYFTAVKDKYLGVLKPSEIRVKVDDAGTAHLSFLRFACGTFTTAIPTNTVETIRTPDGHSIKAYIGGREEGFFNDLPGFFRSINYAPQFYNVPHSLSEARELKIPKTLLELEGNHLFQFRPCDPDVGQDHEKGSSAGAVDVERR